MIHGTINAKATPRRRVTLATLGGGVAIIAALTVACALEGYRVNVTPSYPLGLWQVTALDHSPSVGDRVFICPTDAAVEIGRERGYLPRGSCPSGTAPLIKTVVAVAGQVVSIEDRVVVDGLPLPFTAVRASDGAGRPMALWTGGVVPPGQVFVYSHYGPSYDSRYFGPLPIAGILGLAQPILTFEQ